MSTKFQFSYVTGDGEIYRSSSFIYAESLFFAVKKFKGNHNEDCKIMAVKGWVKTEMGVFEIVGITE